MTLQNNYSGQLVKKVKQQQCLDSKLYFILKLTYKHPILSNKINTKSCILMFFRQTSKDDVHVLQADK